MNRRLLYIEFSVYLILVLILSLRYTANAQLDCAVVQLFMAEGDSAVSKLGYQVAGLGDQNGDGFDDILVGAPGDRKAFIYFGGNPMDTIPDIIFHKHDENLFGFCLCNLGDVNGDSYSDFAIGSTQLVRVYWGGSDLDTLVDMIIPYAARLCAAGDVNGDGYNDILRSDINWQSGRGKAFLYLGDIQPDSIADWSVIGDSAQYHFGYGLTGNGDINGDGYDDIAIGGYRQVKNVIYPYMKVFYGGAQIDTIPAFIIDSLEQPLDISTRAILIDLNSDGLFDLCIDSHEDTSAVIFYGPIVPNILPDLFLHGTYLSGKVWEIAEAGDINNDGYSDIITGNYDGVGGLGEILVFLGGPYMDGEWDIMMNGFQGPYKCAGRSVGRAGDVNGDGVDDILFGSWCEYDFNLQGRVVIFSGDTTLTSVSFDPSLQSEPELFLLGQNYPNPFNESTMIEFQISVYNPTRTVLAIYNILGQKVVTLIDENLDSGIHKVTWNGKNSYGLEVESGIYFCHMHAGNIARFNKILLLK
jgi:hypothetical protein